MNLYIYTYRSIVYMCIVYFYEEREGQSPCVVFKLNPCRARVPLFSGLFLHIFPSFLLIFHVFSGETARKFVINT